MSITGERNPESRASKVLDRWLAELMIGAPMQHGALAVLPVYRMTAGRGLEYRSLGPAIAAGDVTVAEAAQATVPTLLVNNRGGVPILILDGEEVVGGRQNRIVNSSLLVPPKTVFDLSVSCIEQGRWRETAPAFKVGESAYPSLRRQKSEQVSAALARAGKVQADQGQIWNEIDQLHRRTGATSATRAMGDAYDQSRRHLDDADRILACPTDGPVGIIALVSGRAHCADVFDRAETLRTHWSRLIRSYSLDAVNVPHSRLSQGSALRLLSRARQARRTAYPSAGLGTDVRLNGNGIVGAALVEDGVAVHISVFRQRMTGGQHGDA